MRRMFFVVFLQEKIIKNGLFNNPVWLLDAILDLSQDGIAQACFFKEIMFQLYQNVIK